MTSQKWSIVFADDSGNTGRDLLNKTQPFLVIAHLLATEGLLAALAQFKSRSGELKFSTLKSNKRWDIIESVGTILVQEGCSLLYTIIHKKYQLAAHVVETYLDPLSNEAAPPSQDSEFRRRAAETITTYCDDLVLREFQDANGLYDAVHEVGRKIASILRESPSDFAFTLARMISSSDEYFLFSPTLTVPDVPGVHHGGQEIKTSPSVEAFWPSLIHLQSVLHDAGVRLPLVADDDAAFADAYDHVFRTFGSRPLTIPMGPRRGGVTLDRITDYRRTLSHSNLGVQAADLCAGVLRSVLAAPEHPELQAAYRPFLACFRPLREMVFMMMSDDTRRGILPVACGVNVKRRRMR